MRSASLRRSVAAAVLGMAMTSGATAVAAQEPVASVQDPAAAERQRVAQARQRADAAAELLPKRLLAELQAAMASGGPVAGIRVCSEIAQKVTADLGAQQGLTIRRTSLRTRNPANDPDPFERRWLVRAEETMKVHQPPKPIQQVVKEKGQRELRVIKPIMFPGGICSQCHGHPAEISDEVRALLRQRYPKDRATGFSAGDLRGAISVRVPLTDTATPAR